MSQLILSEEEKAMPIMQTPDKVLADACRYAHTVMAKTANKLDKPILMVAAQHACVFTALETNAASLDYTVKGLTCKDQELGDWKIQIRRLDDKSPGHDLSSVVVVDREVMPPWTQEEPKESGSYWMWDGSDESLPAHVEVFWSGTDNRCFVPSGQYGWTRHQDMDELKGYWWCKLVCPSLPVSAALASLNAGGEG